MAFLVSTVVSGIAVQYCYVRCEAVVLSSLGPGCRAVEARLDDSATATLFGLADTVLGDSTGLWHVCSGVGEPPLLRTSRNLSLIHL